MRLMDSQSVPLTAGQTANTKPHIHAHFSKVRAARPTKTACKNAEVPTASVYHYPFYKKKKKRIFIQVNRHSVSLTHWK